MQLADGCMVPACGGCFAGIEKGKKLAEERGLYDPNKNVSGGDRMKIPRGNTGGNYISVEDAEKRGITSFKILDEGELDTYTPKEGEPGKPTTRLVVEVSFDGQKSTDAKHWKMNDKCRNALIDLWTDETEKWIGKIVEITFAGEEKFRHIAVDMLRTKKDQ